MLAPRRRAALGDLAKGVVVDAQEADRAGGLPGGGFDQRALGAQAGEGEAVAAAGLLDQGGVAQGLEDAGRVAAHIIGDGQDETGGQLAQRGARAGEGGGIGEEALAGKQIVKFAGALHDIAGPGFFDHGDVVGHAPEHLLHGFGGFAIIAAAHIAADEHLAGIIGQVDLGRSAGMGGVGVRPVAVAAGTARSAGSVWSLDGFTRLFFHQSSPRLLVSDQFRSG